MFLKLSKKLFLIAIIIISFSLSKLYGQKGGYVDKLSVAQGDTITFYISSELPKIAISFFKLENTPIYKAISDSFNTSVQNVPAESGYAKGFNWNLSLQYSIPLTWETGVYRAQYEITNDSTAAIIFIVKEDVPGSYSKSLFILSTNTWNAYNNWGGKSIYAFNSTNSTRAFKVSFQRPMGSIDSTGKDLGVFGAPDYYVYGNKLINWAANNNILFETASMYDLDTNPNLLSNYDIVFLAGHNEYWSMEERVQLENFVNGGGKLMSLSGNTSWWQVRFEDNGKTMVCYKDKNADPVKDPTSTVNWWADPVNKPANVVFGADFREGGFVNSGSFLPKQDGYGDYAAFNTHYWVFNGTGLKDGDEFGFERELVGYEADGALYYYLNGVPTVIDTLDEPLNFRIFGSSPTQRAITIDSIQYGHATMGLFTNTNGGAVFNGATTNWVNALYTDTTNNNIVPDSTVDRITRNVYNKFKENRLPPEIVSWTPFMLDNKLINRDPVVINTRDTLVGPGTSVLLTVNAVDPKNQPLHYAWEVNGNPIGTDNSTYNFTNPYSTVQLVKFIAKVYVYNAVDTSSISWNMFDNELVINEIPSGQVTQGENYSYQVETFNFNRDSLTFSLINNSPSWLSIETTTGLITGTAPLTNSFSQVTVFVSDQSENSDARSYNLNVVTGIEFESTIPNNYQLMQNYPNPFNPQTIISFQIPTISNVTLKIYDVLGREVRTLVNEEMKAGSYKVDFNSKGLSSGIYFYRITAGNFSEIKKMVLLK